MPPLQRAAIKAAPAWLRTGMLLRLARQLGRNSYTGSRAISRFRRGLASIDVRASVFCTVRQPASQPLRGFYAAALTRLLTLFNMHARAEDVPCRGTGEPTRLLQVAM